MKLLETALNEIPTKLRKLLEENSQKTTKMTLNEWEKEITSILGDNPEIDQLENILILAKGFYYEEGKWLREKFNMKEFISDNLYDKLETEFEAVKGTKMDIGISTNIVNGDFPPHIHQRVKGVSQNKEHNLAGALDRMRIKDISDIKKIISEKLDGSSLYLVYDENGDLVQGITRGDGTKGFDITINVKGIQDVPLKIDMTDYKKNHPDIKFIEIRGEALISVKNFDKLNEEMELSGEEPYQNTRNMMGGVLMSPYSKNSNILMFKAYQEILELEDGNILEENEDKKFDRLKSIGFKTPWYKMVNTFEDIEKVYNEYFETKRSQILLDEEGYAIDGLVVSVNDASVKNELGMTNRRENGSFAIKFPADFALTKSLGADFRIGKSSGNITPRGLVNPIDIGGVIVSKASLANKEHFYNMMISEGDLLGVRRSGDVIPQIIINTKFVEYYANTKKYIEILMENIKTKDKTLDISIGEKNIDLIQSQFLDEMNDKLDLEFKCMLEVNKVIKKNIYDKDNELVENPKSDKLISLQIFKQMNTLIKKETLKQYKNFDKDLDKSVLTKDIEKDITETFVETYDNNKDIVEYLNTEHKLKEINENNISFTSTCPSCGSLLVEEKAYTKCVNEDCNALNKGKIINFISKNDVKGIGEKTIDFLYDNDIIKNIPDLFDVKEEDFVIDEQNGKKVYYEGWGERAIERYFNSLKQIETISDINFLGSLSIPMYGRSRFETILEVFDFDKIVSNSITKEEYQTITGLKESVDILMKGLDDNKDLMNDLLSKVKITKTEKMSEEDKEKIKIYLTGSLSEFGFKNKKAFFLEYPNFNFDVKFSKSACDLLLTSEVSTKIAKAEKWNMPIIKFEDFDKKIDKDKKYSLEEFLSEFSSDSEMTLGS